MSNLTAEELESATFHLHLHTSHHEFVLMKERAARGVARN